MGTTARLRRRAPAAAVLVAVTTVAGACGGGSGAEAGSGGQVVISGSSTVEPISIAVGQAFEEANPGVRVSVDGPGTGDGFELFCQGQTDISDASRPIAQEEIDSCGANGIEFVELVVAFDGIAVLGHPDNPLDCLAFADMYALVGPESQDIGSWEEAGGLAADVGSDTDFPDLDLDISAPGDESGTFDSFVELVIEDIAEERGEEPTTRLYSGSPNDSVIVEGIAGADGSFGWVGYAFAGSARGVKVFDVEDRSGTCVEPTDDAISDGSYPLSRPLFIYVNADRAAERPEVARFVDFYLDDGASMVSQTGYVALPEDQMAATRDRWASRTTGRSEERP